MRRTPSTNPYEVYCTHCSVSFPVGTRVCIHCGQPIGRTAAEAAAGLLTPASDEQAAQDFPLRAVKASPLTFVWLLAAVATVVYRACS